jgi:hypothetical protein
MNRIIVCLVFICSVIASCNKAVKPPVSYTVTNDVNDSLVQDIFIPDNGTAHMMAHVKFLEGWQGADDKVTLVLTGVPAHVKVTPDTITAIPTYTADFVFTSTNAVQGVYNATLTAYTAVGLPQAYNFRINVIPADCASLFWGNISGSSACTSRTYTHTATGTSGGTNVLMIKNFGGYGVNCNVKVVFDCNKDSLTIPFADYGNGVKLQGKGVFNGSTMIIDYTATTIPTGGSESCTLTYTK